MSSTPEYPGDDEDFITRMLPQQQGWQSAAVSGALAVHFSSWRQKDGLERNTTLLEEYTQVRWDMSDGDQVTGHKSWDMSDGDQVVRGHESWGMSDPKHPPLAPCLTRPGRLLLPHEL